MRRLKAFFFDLDGTLLDSEVIYVDAAQESLAEKGFDITHHEALELVYGRGAKDIFLDMLERFPGAYRDIQDAEEEVRRHFLRLRAERDIRIHGSVDLLKSLAKEFPVAIVSGSPRQDIEDGISVMGVASWVAFYLGAEDYFPGKPDPSCYLLAAERLALPPETCLVFEDSRAGVNAAKQAGMACVGLQREKSPRQDLSRADLILSDLAEFELPRFEAKLS